MIPYLRIYELSIINYIKYEVLPLHFLERINNEPLVYNDKVAGYVTESKMVPLPTSFGRGWALFDEATVNGNLVIDTTAEQTSRVAVAGASSFDIDYANGRILNPDTVPTSVSYYWNYVSLIRGWPGISPPPLPVVAVDVDVSNKDGYQLGGGQRDNISGSIYIFATSESEKRDITDIIHNSIYNKALPIQNWHEGSFLSYEGTYSGFLPTTISGIGIGTFREVDARLDGSRLDWSEINRHRSRINFEFEIFRD